MRSRVFVCLCVGVCVCVNKVKTRKFFHQLIALRHDEGGGSKQTKMPMSSKIFFLVFQDDCLFFHFLSQYLPYLKYRHQSFPLTSTAAAGAAAGAATASTTPRPKSSSTTITGEFEMDDCRHLFDRCKHYVATTLDATMLDVLIGKIGKNKNFEFAPPSYRLSLTKQLLNNVLDPFLVTQFVNRVTQNQMNQKKNASEVKK